MTETTAIRNKTSLKDRVLPNYTRGEEIFNMTSHIVGGALSVIILAICLFVAIRHKNTMGIVTGSIFGVSAVLLYTVSSVYHGLFAGISKRVMRILDHCVIYVLIAGTYTPIALCAVAKESPVLGWSVFGFVWAMAALAITLTAIDLHKYRIFSMICYIAMGWCVIVFAGTVLRALGPAGFAFLLSGGVAYTVGAVLYGLGSSMRYMHCVFHLFVIAGTLLHFLCIVLTVL